MQVVRTNFHPVGESNPRAVNRKERRLLSPPFCPFSLRFSRLRVQSDWNWIENEPIFLLPLCSPSLSSLSPFSSGLSSLPPPPLFSSFFKRRWMTFLRREGVTFASQGYEISIGGSVWLRFASSETTFFCPFLFRLEREDPADLVARFLGGLWTRTFLHTRYI